MFLSMIQVLTFSAEKPKFTIIIWDIFSWKTDGKDPAMDPEAMTAAQTVLKLVCTNLKPFCMVKGPM